MNADTASLTEYAKLRELRSTARQEAAVRRTVKVSRSRTPTEAIQETELSVGELTVEELEQVVKLRNNKLKEMAGKAKEEIAAATASCVETCEEGSKLIQKMMKEGKNGNGKNGSH